MTYLVVKHGVQEEFPNMGEAMEAFAQALDEDPEAGFFSVSREHGTVVTMDATAFVGPLTVLTKYARGKR